MLFAVAALLIILSIPLVLQNSPAAGWNIFLGLLLFGAVASGNKHAPTVALVLAAIFAVRCVVGTIGAGLVAGAIEAVFAVATAAAGFHLRQQARSA
jgi:hypothetical protein